MPVYNAELFLEETMESLLTQTYQDFEIVISDNGSTDRTQEMCRAYAARDPRVQYHRNDINRGAAWNYNRVVELSDGELFKWAAADDICLPTFLEKCVSALDANPGAALSCTDAIEIDEHGKERCIHILPDDAVSESPGVRFGQLVKMDHFCQHIFGVIRMKYLRRTDLIGNFTDSDRVTIAHLGLFGPFVIIHEKLFLNRAHSQRSTRTHTDFRERMLWFDPTAGDRMVFPFWREFSEFWGTVSRADLSFQDRLPCYREMLRWFWTHKQWFRWELQYYPKRWFVRHVPGAGAAINWVKTLFSGSERSAES
jgi:glycosyltransferase involved in cell wall biosynthesis